MSKANLETKVDHILSILEDQNEGKNVSDLEKKIIARQAEIEQINYHAFDTLRNAYKYDQSIMKGLDLSRADDTPLTEDELQQIKDFWEPYSFAYRNNPETQRVFSRMSGKFDPCYIGWGVQYHLLAPFWESKFIRKMTLKHLTAWFLRDLPMPKTYVLCEWGGMYFDEDRNQISKEQAIEICCKVFQQNKKILVKPSDGVGGRGIQLLDEKTTKEQLNKLFDQLKDSFLLQEHLKNHESYMAKESLNTFRITTLYHNDEVKWIGTVYRMATSKAVADNWHQGGLACPISEDGIGGEFAVSMAGKRVSVHPNGFKFAGHKFYNYDKAHNLAIELHKKFPMVKYIAWDIAVTEDGEPKVLEFGNPGGVRLTQACGINPYGSREALKEIMDEYLIKRFYYNKAVLDWNYRDYKDHIVLTKYCGFDTNVQVPEKIAGKRVAFIAKNAISQKEIQKVSVPKRVKMDPAAVTAPNAKIQRES